MLCEEIRSPVGCFLYDPYPVSDSGLPALGSDDTVENLKHPSTGSCYDSTHVLSYELFKELAASDSSTCCKDQAWEPGGQ